MRCRCLLLGLSMALPLAVGVPSAHAQLGGLLKKAPKPPAVPGMPSTPATSTAKEPEAVLTADLLDRTIGCMKVERQTLEQGIGEARKKAAAAADRTGQQEKQMALVQSMMERQQKHQECLEAAMLKDKETPRLERLQDQAEDETDDAKADELNRQASALEDAIRKRAEPACASLKVDMAGEMQQAAQAQQTRQESEQDMMSRVSDEAQAAAARACGLDVDEYAKLLELMCVAFIHDGEANAGDKALMQARAADLKPALEALGCSTRGFPWGERIPPIK